MPRRRPRPARAPRFALGALLALLAAGCASTAGTQIPVNSRPVNDNSNLFLQGSWNLQRGSEAHWVGASVPLSRAEALSLLPAVYDSLGIGSVDFRRADVGVVGKHRFNPRRIGGDRLSNFLDCGYGVTAEAYADAYDVFMALQTLVTSEGADASLVETVIMAEADPRQTRGDPVRCTTKLELEKRVVKALRDRAAPVGDTVGGGPPG